MAEVFVDANVFIRHLTQDHPVHSPKATAFLARIERGEFRARTADTVIFETVFTLERHYRETKHVIRDALVPLIELPGILLSGKKRLRRAFELYADRNMSFGDACHVAVMEQYGITDIASFDKDFDGLPGITRVEPS